MKSNADRTGVVFGIENEVPVVGGKAAQRRENDCQVAGGTMSRSGASCLCCRTIPTGEDIRLEGQAGRLGSVLTAVVVDGKDGKEYRPPSVAERVRSEQAAKELPKLFAGIPFGTLNEPIPQGGSRAGGGSPFTVYTYGLTRWRELFTPSQLFALGTFTRHTRAARENMQAAGYPAEWIEAVVCYLAVMVDRLADRCSCLARWNMTGEKIEGTFARFALPMVWDFAEVNPLGDTSGGYSSAIEWVCLAAGHFTAASRQAPAPHVVRQSAKVACGEATHDLILTDPPYYDAIPYSDLMDFFYLWLRRTLHGLAPSLDESFQTPVGPKWDAARNDGELIDDASRHGGDAKASKSVYEEGMFHAFQACQRALAPEGRLVVVFAHKHPNAWETLVSAIIRAGFVVDGSWPIQTERSARVRSLSSAALSSSVWLVCKKRPAAARPGWDNRVLDEMKTNIHQRLHDYWKAGIRGPDFVWAATGPALEAFSKHPAVKKATAPGETMSVSEFLRAVRRLVVDFVVGRVLTGNGDGSRVEGLDDITTYYLLHRHDFGIDDAPAGACILYAVSCGLSDSALVDRHDLLLRTGGKGAADDEADESDEEEEADADEGGRSGSKVKLKPWSQRKRKTMGYDAEGRLAPLIDQVHRLLHLWKAGEVVKVDEYLNDRGLRRNALFHQLLQALIELSERGGEERSLLECVSNHVAARGVDKPAEPTLPFEGDLFAGGN